MNDGENRTKTEGPRRPWVKGGPSPNPHGRPPRVAEIEALLASKSVELIEKAIKIALEGDVAAIKLLLDRILPPRKYRPVSLPAPSSFATVDDVIEAHNRVFAQMVTGEISIEEGQALAEYLDRIAARIKDRAAMRTLESGEAKILVVDPQGDLWPASSEWPLGRKKKDDGSDKPN
jgi:hypothetical protein